MMKFIYMILFLLIVTGCGLLMQGYTDNYKLENNTSYQLQIQGFSYRYEVLSSDTIFMKPHSSLSYRRERGEGSDQRTFFSVADVDSVHVVFDSE